jgi:TonB family protein
MLCFLKRVLPFTLTLVIGTALGGVFNFLSAPSAPRPATETAELRAASETGKSAGCRNRFRANSESYYTSARIITQAQPLYTPLARSNRMEGDVILRVTLKSDGTVGEVEIIKSLPYGLTEQSLRAARLMTFAPATRNGVAIDEIKTITYSFNLN